VICLYRREGESVLNGRKLALFVISKIPNPFNYKRVIKKVHYSRGVNIGYKKSPN
jgi:hypothetical protein